MALGVLALAATWAGFARLPFPSRLFDTKSPNAGFLTAKFKAVEQEQEVKFNDILDKKVTTVCVVPEEVDLREFVKSYFQIDIKLSKATSYFQLNEEDVKYVFLNGNEVIDIQSVDRNIVDERVNRFVCYKDTNNLKLVKRESKISLQEK